MHDHPHRTAAKSNEVAAVESIEGLVRALDRARLHAGLTKATLARRIEAPPATLRRLFTSGDPNPTLGTVLSLARALGYRLELVPIPPADKLDGPLAGDAASQGLASLGLEARSIYDALERPSTVDALCQSLDRGAAVVIRALMELRLAGLVLERPMGCYRRA